jgi:hypothetical protein
VDGVHPHLQPTSKPIGCDQIFTLPPPLLLLSASVPHTLHVHLVGCTSFWTTTVATTCRAYFLEHQWSGLSVPVAGRQAALL